MKHPDSVFRLCAVLFLTGILRASQPAIFFSDLESGPKSGGERNAGAYVTIFGKGFGSSQGNSFITVGGGRAAAYPVWTDDRISFQLGAAAATGDIVVNSSGDKSNPVSFTVRPGNIFVVALNGKDHNTGSFTSPWQTLTKARDSMKPGDIVYARNGVAQIADDGQGWRTCMLLRTGGTAGLPVAMVTYPGEKATIGDINGPGSGIRTNEKSSGYWVFAGFTLRGQNEAVAIWGASNWRFVGNDMSCPNGDYASACFETSSTSYVTLLGNNVHDTGKATASALYHGVYLSTDTNHVDIGWNIIANVHGCRGIQVHSSPLQGGGPSDPTGHSQYDIAIHDNIIHDTQCDGIIFATIDPSKGKVEVYNNVIYAAGKGPNNPEGSGNWACINAQSWTNTGPAGSGTVEIYNNTMYNCGTFANPPYQRGTNAISYSGPNPNIKIHLRNNIIYQPPGVPYLIVYGPKGKLCGDNCPYVFGSNNLFYGSGPAPEGATLTNSLNKDPGFVNPAGADFHLRDCSSRPHARAGTGLLRDQNDIPGNPKPACDLGAFAVQTIH